MKLSIIIPIYNEAIYLTRCLENIVQVNIPGWTKEIIAVNDGSTDETLKLLRQFNRHHSPLKIISSSQNYGKGHALKQGIKVATGDVLIIQDADLEYDPIDYQTILSEYDNKSVSVVYGSRILGAKIYHNYNAGFFFLLGGIALTKIVNFFFGTKITDQSTCYKTWRSTLSRGLLDSCHRHGFEFEVEMTAFFAKTQQIREVPIHYYPRTVRHGKKIRLTDFLKSVILVLRCRFQS